MEREALSRRQFFGGTCQERSSRIRPPGITAEGLRHCSGCNKCVERCQNKIIKLANGLPEIDFHVGECIFCGECAAACNEQVFSQEVVTRFDHVVVFEKTCLAFSRVECQACRDACATSAIRFRPVRNGPFIPELLEDLCTGCGACIWICPVNAVTTIHRTVEPQYA